VLRCRDASPAYRRVGSVESCCVPSTPKWGGHPAAGRTSVLGRFEMYATEGYFRMKSPCVTCSLETVLDTRMGSAEPHSRGLSPPRAPGSGEEVPNGQLPLRQEAATGCANGSRLTTGGVDRRPSHVRAELAATMEPSGSPELGALTTGAPGPGREVLGNRRAGASKSLKYQSARRQFPSTAWPSTSVAL
jgi:hypothetical protein